THVNTLHRPFTNVCRARFGDTIHRPRARLQACPISVCFLLVAVSNGTLTLLTQAYCLVTHSDSVHAAFYQTLAKIPVVVKNRKVLIETIYGENVLAPG